MNMDDDNSPSKNQTTLGRKKITWRWMRPPLKDFFHDLALTGTFFSRESRTKLTRTMLPPAPTALVAPNAKEGTSIRRNAL